MQKILTMVVLALVALTSTALGGDKEYWAKVDAKKAADKAFWGKVDTRAYWKKIDDEKDYWKRYDARKAAAKADAKIWTLKAPARGVVRPTTTLPASAARSVAITNNAAARNAHFQALMARARQAQSRR